MSSPNKLSTGSLLNPFTWFQEPAFDPSKIISPVDLAIYGGIGLGLYWLLKKVTKK